MNRTYEEWLKYYENATKEQVIFDMMLDMQEIERLNNIINEFDKWVKNKNFKEGTYCIDCIQVLNKLKELKKNEKH